MRSAFPVVAVLVLALVLGACGDSSADKPSTQSRKETAPAQSREQKAQASVCAAKADIGTQVDGLKDLTPATFTTDAVTQRLAAIKKDLEDMASAQADLSSDRRSEAEAANKAFTSSLSDITSQLLTSLSASDAKTALVTALQQLETSYEKAFEPLDCG